MRWVFALLCLGLVGLMGRMAWLQVFQASTLEARARSFQTQQTDPLGTRRPIVDRAGRLVALDEERFRLWAHPNNFRFPGDDPSVVRKPLDVARRLSGLIAVPMADLVKRMGDRPSGIRLAEGLDPETASEVRRLGIHELHVLDRIGGTDPKARKHQVRECPGPALVVVFVVNELCIFDVVQKIVELVAADRVIRQ